MVRLWSKAMYKVPLLRVDWVWWSSGPLAFPWRVFKGPPPLAQAAQAEGFGARPRVGRVAAVLAFCDGLPLPAGVHSIHVPAQQY